jgi:hypothetical protein
VLVLAAVVLGGPLSARAETPPRTAPLTLTWNAGPGCPTADQVAAEVAQNLTEPSTALGPFVAVVDVDGAVGQRWRASLLFQAGDTRAQRRFEAESCEAIASAASLIIALWAEGGADASPSVKAGPAPAVRQQPDTAEEPPAISRAPVASWPTRVAAKYVGWGLMANGLVDVHTMPSTPAGGLEVAGGPVWDKAPLRLRALGGLSFFPSQQVTTPYGLPGALELFSASTRGCADVVLGAVELGPCLGGELDAMHGSGQSYSVSSTQLWISLLGAAMVSWRISPTVALFGRAEAVLPTTRRRFNVMNGAGVEEGYKVPEIAGRGAFGLEMRFW